MKKLIALILLALSLSAQALPTTLMEGFDNLAASGWTIINVSSPVGTTSWFQGNPTVFSAQAGPANSYAAANFNATNPSGGLVDVWLISPEISFISQSLSFFTRTADPGFNDGLLVWLSASGASLSLASFSQLLVSVNGNNSTGGYPNDWTQFSALLGLASGSGRIGFEYRVSENANVLADYIGIDTVEVVARTVPEPSTLAIAVLGLGMLAFSLRSAKRG